MSRIKKWRQLHEKKEEGWSPTKIGVIALLLVFGGGFLLFGLNFFQNNSAPSIGEIHWHAIATLQVCGEQKPLPVPFPGQHHKGLPLMHTHDDGELHIEGFVGNPSDITLGKFLQAIGIVFTDNQFFDKKNGDLCNGKPGQAKLFVNGKDNGQLAEYSIKDEDRFEIKFE